MSAGPIAPPFDEGDARAIVQAFEEAWNRRVAERFRRPVRQIHGGAIAMSSKEPHQYREGEWPAGRFSMALAIENSRKEHRGTRIYDWAIDVTAQRAIQTSKWARTWPSSLRRP